MNKKIGVGIDPTEVGVRLGLCAAAIAGTAATAPVANAAIVTFNTSIAIPQTTAGVYINLLTGATGSSAAGVAGWDFNPYNSNGGTRLGFYWNQNPAASHGGVASTGSGPYLNLAPGTVVGPASTFSNTIAGTVGSPFLTTSSLVLGFRFQNENTNTVNYGYLNMTTTASNGFPATITGWSFEDSGASITVAGDSGVPEPSSILLTSAGLALGALQMRRWRRRNGIAK